MKALGWDIGDEEDVQKMKCRVLPSKPHPTITIKCPASHKARARSALATPFSGSQPVA